MHKRIINLFKRKLEKSCLLDMINMWPQFVQYILINDFVQFEDIVQLTLTCRKLRDYFHEMLKAYHLLCQYHYFRHFAKRIVIEHNKNFNGNEQFDIDFSNKLFKSAELFYSNEYEKKLFQRIFDSFRLKPSIDEASFVGNIVILDWYHEYGCKKHNIKFSYSCFAIDIPCDFGLTNVLDWFLKYELEEHGELRLIYTTKAMDGAAGSNHINALNWFLEQHLKYGIPLKYTKDALEEASFRGYIGVLDWFLENHLKYGIPFLYTTSAVKFASLEGRVEVLDWWLQTCKTYGFPFKYNDLFIEESLNKKIIKSIKWWFTDFKSSKLNKSFNYFNNPIRNAYVTELMNMRPSIEQNDSFEKNCAII